MAISVPKGEVRGNSLDGISLRRGRLPPVRGEPLQFARIEARIARRMGRIGRRYRLCICLGTARQRSMSVLTGLSNVPAALDEPLRTKDGKRLHVVSERARQIEAEDRCRSGTCDVAKENRIAV